MATFEDQLAELEKVVERLERGELTLDDNVSLFERGMHLSNSCRQELERAESRIQVLLEPEGAGPVRAAELDVSDGDGDGADEDDL